MKNSVSIKIHGGIIRGMSWVEKANYLCKTAAWSFLMSPVSPANFLAGNSGNDDKN